ncbi:MAG TPA: HAD family hydrolase [Leptospiraceae bacterium]|nr:HAD family hydrolase [Leptospiraceae bacterium]HMW05429.1 HAD family hydrolase [Leptospiraceae bacterium]HMX31422.1 HAD family hydrolase [Leptospiraceae bacterium]HMY30939.1 HAD family hydrolase [Leptospiraceae bacterium]HMZ63350.1 HAD family hydrolase [Leptospiraceae bacterium]
MDNTNKPLLILDLDETLLHANVDLVHNNYSYQTQFHYVYNRPYLKEFLIDTNQSFQLSVWSSGEKDYVEELIEKSFPREIILSFVWDRSHCTHKFDRKLKEQVYIKNLNKITKEGFSLERTLIVDDSPEKFQLHRKNGISIQPFQGDSNDSELLKLKRYLQKIANSTNFQKLDKVNWNQR